MGALDEERGETMILRAWVEDGRQPRLRVRVIRVSPGQADEPAISAAATIDGVCALVRIWLEVLLNDADRCSVEPRPDGSG
jgi:hypothetical protein